VATATSTDIFHYPAAAFALTPKERVLETMTGGESDRIPLGEFATDYPVVEAALGRRTYWRAKIREVKALWSGKRDEVVESQKRDIVEFTLKMGLDMVPVVLVPSSYDRIEKPKRIGPNMWRDSEGNHLRLAGQARTWSVFGGLTRTRSSRWTTSTTRSLR